MCFGGKNGGQSFSWVSSVSWCIQWLKLASNWPPISSWNWTSVLKKILFASKGLNLRYQAPSLFDHVLYTTKPLVNSKITGEFTECTHMGSFMWWSRWFGTKKSSKTDRGRLGGLLRDWRLYERVEYLIQWLSSTRNVLLLWEETFTDSPTFVSRQISIYWYNRNSWALQQSRSLKYVILIIAWQILDLLNHYITNIYCVLWKTIYFIIDFKIDFNWHGVLVSNVGSNNVDEKKVSNIDSKKFDRILKNIKTFYHYM